MSPLSLRADALLIYRDGYPNVVASVFASSTLPGGSPNEIYAAATRLARVFAAAPEMLALIKEAAADYESMVGPENGGSADSEFLARLRAVIAKAEGTS